VNEFFEKWNEYYANFKPKGMRLGQAAFNILIDVRPDLAERVRGKVTLDPFYKDANLPAFLEWVASHWADDVPLWVQLLPSDDDPLSVRLLPADGQ
jgi:hypothetical protein